MISEWLKVMIEEISRKKAEAVEARSEEERRRQESGCTGNAGGKVPHDETGRG
jgi:hypothetical protein